MNAIPETQESASADLQFCLLESQVAPWRRWRAAGALSVLLHLLALAGWTSIPAEWLAAHPAQYDVALFERHSVPLVAPRFELTQQEKTHGPVTKELDLEQLQANLHAPAPGSAPSRPRLMTLPAASRPAPLPAPVLEPPKAEAANRGPQPAALGTGLQIQPDLPPPPPPAQTPVKNPFETPGSPAGATGGSGSTLARIQPPPRGTVDEAIHQALRRGGGSGLVIGDSEEMSPLSIPGGANAPAKNGSSVELMSDPLGVDFRPYLIGVLAAVRRNWFNVIPESARMGLRRGKVLIQFSIDRQGKVPKLVIAMPSGTEALDRAAVAGISASNPFPPLPPEFKGEHIRLQLAFLYNTAQ